MHAPQTETTGTDRSERRASRLAGAALVGLQAGLPVNPRTLAVVVPLLLLPLLVAVAIYLSMTGDADRTAEPTDQRQLTTSDGVVPAATAADGAEAEPENAADAGDATAETDAPTAAETDDGAAALAVDGPAEGPTAGRVYECENGCFAVDVETDRPGVVESVMVPRSCPRCGGDVAHHSR